MYTNPFRSSTRRIPKVDLTLVCLIAYVILYLLRQSIQIDLYAVPGLALLFYLPGRQAMDLYTPLQKPWRAVGQAALAVFLSVAAVVTIQIFLGTRGITTSTTIEPVLIINAILCAVRLIMRKRKEEKLDGPENTGNMQKALYDLWPLLVVFGVLVVAIALNPYPADADGFLTALQRSVECHCVSVSFRQSFISYQVLVNLVLGLPIVTIFRVLFPSLFFVSTWFLFDYAVRRVKHISLAHIGYLSILIAPVLVSEVNIIRPQVGMLIFTLPILIMSIEAWRTGRVLYIGTSVWFSLVAIGFHELSFVLLMVAFIPLIAKGVQIVFVHKSLKWGQIALAAIIIFPYYKLLSLQHYFLHLDNNIQSVIRQFPAVHWRWWFIDSYVTIDGFNVGWPGVQSLYYYAYSGLLLLIFSFGLFFFVLKRRAMSITIIIPMVYAAIFLSFAELLPRLGFFFVPNRAWVHLVLALSVLVVMLYENMPKRRTLSVLTVWLPLVLTLIGLAGTFYVANNNVTEVFREEISALHYVKNTPSNSLFLSTQDNRTLIQFYGQRRYAAMPVDHIIDRTEFDTMVAQKLADLSIQHKVEIAPEIRDEARRYQDNQLISIVTNIVSPRQYSVTVPDYQAGPVYFIYSMRKSSGQNATRGYNSTLVDLINRDTYEHIDYQPVYDDGSVVILKLK